MAGTINEPSAKNETKKPHLYFASAGAIVYLRDLDNDPLEKRGIVTYAGPVSATTVEEARLVAQQCLLQMIVEKEQHFSNIEFSEGDITEIFQSDLKLWMKMAQARSRD